MAKRQYRLGRNTEPVKGRKIYPWEKLKRAGDCFLWLDRSKFHTLRVQVAVRKRLYGVTYSVNLDPEGVRVTRR